MRLSIRSAFLAAGALGAVGAALCAAPDASAQSYGQPYGYSTDRYAPPPPPPPPAPGQVFQRDDNYVAGADSHNSDGSYGYRNYTSRPDATPDDPNGYAYQAEQDRRSLQAGRYRNDVYVPPPRYAYGQDGYNAPAYPGRYGDAYARPYDDGRRPPPPRYVDRADEDDDDAPSPPRNTTPRYDGGYPGAPSYTPAPSYRGW